MRHLNSLIMRPVTSSRNFTMKLLPGQEVRSPAKANRVAAAFRKYMPRQPSILPLSPLSLSLSLAAH